MKQPRFVEKRNAARTVHTRVNTPFETWCTMVLEEFARLEIDPSSVSALRMKHAWEGGDTTTGWAQHVFFNNKLRARTKLMKSMNKDK